MNFPLDLLFIYQLNNVTRQAAWIKNFLLFASALLLYACHSDSPIDTEIDPYVQFQWYLDGGKNKTTANINKRSTSYTGKGVRVALIDDGLDLEHPDLVHAIHGDVVSYVSPITKESFAGQHGTACAGIIAAQSNNGIGIQGIAPEASPTGCCGCLSRHENCTER